MQAVPSRSDADLAQQLEYPAPLPRPQGSSQELPAKAKELQNHLTGMGVSWLLV